MSEGQGLGVRQKSWCAAQASIIGLRLAPLAYGATAKWERLLAIAAPTSLLILGGFAKRI